MPALLGHAYLVLITLIGWTLFYFDDLGRATSHLSVMFGLKSVPLLDMTTRVSLMNEAVLAGLVVAASLPLLPWAAERLSRIRAGRRFLSFWEAGGRGVVNAALLAASTAMLVGSSYNPFLYFRF